MKKKLGVVNAEKNSKSPIVNRARLVILATQTVVHANVTSTARTVTTANRQMAGVHANQTLLAITVNDAPTVSTDQSVCLANAIQLDR